MSLDEFKKEAQNMKKTFVSCMVFLYLVLPGISAAGSLTDNGNGTVTDSGTRLIWQQGESSAMTWETVLAYCEGLTLAGQTDWRLPNIKELSSLVDNAKSFPAINTVFFPNATSSSYWSSTSSAVDALYSWIVSFYYGKTVVNVKTVSSYGRCVRGGQ